jgi:hypothetical protein
VIDRSLIADAEGIFMDEFSPESVGIWDISIESEENVLLKTQSVFTQVLVTKTESIIVDASIETSIEEEDLPTESTVPPDLIHENDPDPAAIISELTVGEVSETDYVSKTIGADNTTVPQTEEPVSDGDPFIFGLIPSILTFVIIIVLYFAVNIVKN